MQELLDLVEDPVSLETPVGDGESMYADLIEDVNSDRPDETTAEKLRRKELAEAFAIVETGRGGAVFPAADAQVGGAQHARHLGLRPMPLFPLPSQLDVEDGVRTCFHAEGFSDDIGMIYP